MIEVSVLPNDGQGDVATAYINMDHIVTIEEWDIPGTDYTGSLLTMFDGREIVVKDKVRSLVEEMRTVKQYEGW